MTNDDPCERTWDPDPKDPGWNCDYDHTGCLWNDGHNTCGHPGDSSTPLLIDGQEVGVLEDLKVSTVRDGVGMGRGNIQSVTRLEIFKGEYPKTLSLEVKRMAISKRWCAEMGVDFPEGMEDLDSFPMEEE